EVFSDEVPGLNIIFQTYFERIINYETIINLPVKGIGIDFVHGDSLEQLKEYGFPKDKVLAAGIIDGRNVWRADLAEKLTILETIKQFVADDQLIIQPSSSLLHLPVTKTSEEKIDTIILEELSFADEKLAEFVALTKGINGGRDAVTTEIKDSTDALESLRATYRSNEAVREGVANLTEEDAVRKSPFSKRIEKQDAKFNLPLLPT